MYNGIVIIIYYITTGELITIENNVVFRVAKLGTDSGGSGGGI